MQCPGVAFASVKSRSLQVACGVVLFFPSLCRASLYASPQLYFCSLLVLCYILAASRPCKIFYVVLFRSKASTTACSVSHVNSGKRTGMSWKSKRVSRMQFTRQIYVSIRPVSSNLHVLCGELICSVSSAFSLLVWYHLRVCFCCPIVFARDISFSGSFLFLCRAYHHFTMKLYRIQKYCSIEKL